MWSFTLCLVAFVFLAIGLVLHVTGIYEQTPASTPAFVLTTIQGCVALAFVLDFSNLIKSGAAHWYIPNASLTDDEKSAKREDISNFLIACLLAKGYVASVFTHNINFARS